MSGASMGSASTFQESSAKLSNAADNQAQDMERSFGSVVGAWFESRSEREQLVVESRLSRPAPERRTLQEIAKDLRITRERVRQLEKRLVKSLVATGAPQYGQVLDAALRRLGCAAPASRVEIEDARLAGITRFQWVFEVLLDVEQIAGVSVYVHDGVSYLLAVSRDASTSMLRDARLAARSLESVDDPPRVDVVAAAVRASAPSACADLQDLLVKVVLHDAVIAVDMHGIPVLVAVERSTDSEIRAVLVGEPRPLHFRDINQRLVDMFGSQRDERTVHNAARSADGVYLLGRGLYGLRKHVGVSESDALLVADFVEELVDSGGPMRQWHGSELLDEVLSAFPGVELEHGVYDLAFVINAHCSSVRPLGRMVYQRTDAPIRPRIDLRQAIVSILREAGQPLQDDDLLARLAEHRGLSPYTTLLLPSEDYVRMEGGRVGLIDRDFGLDPRRMESLTDCLLQLCEEDGKGIHKRQIATRLHIDEVEEPYAAQGVVAHARRDPRVRISVGGYLFPAAWGGPRRPSVAQAVRSAVARLGPDATWTSRDLLESVIAATGQTHLSQQEVSHILGLLPTVVFDTAIQRWRWSP